MVMGEHDYVGWFLLSSLPYFLDTAYAKAMVREGSWVKEDTQALLAE